MTWNDNASMYDEHLGNYRHELDKNKGYFEEIKDSLNDKSSEFEASNISNVEELKNWIKKTDRIVVNPEYTLTYHPESYIHGEVHRPFASLRGLEMSDGTKVITAYRKTIGTQSLAYSELNIKKKKEGYKKIKESVRNRFTLLFDIEDKFYYNEETASGVNKLIEHNLSIGTEVELLNLPIRYDYLSRICFDEKTKKVVIKEDMEKLMIFDCKNKTRLSKVINEINLYPADVICNGNYIYLLGIKKNSNNRNLVIGKYDYNLNFISSYEIANTNLSDYGGSIVADNILYICFQYINIHIFDLKKFSYIEKKSSNSFWENFNVSRDNFLDDNFNINLGNGRKSIYGMTKIFDFKTETIQDLVNTPWPKYNIVNSGGFIDRKGNFNQFFLLGNGSSSYKPYGAFYERVFSI